MTARKYLSTPPLSTTLWAWPPQRTTTRSRRSPTTARILFGWALPAKVSSPHILSAPTPPVGGLPSARPWFLVQPRYSSASTPIATNLAPNNPSPTPSPSPRIWAMAAWTSTRPSPPGANPSIHTELPEGRPVTTCCPRRAIPRLESFWRRGCAAFRAGNEIDAVRFCSYDERGAQTSSGAKANGHPYENQLSLVRDFFSAPAHGGRADRRRN